MGYTKFFSSSKRPILVGKTITKQLGNKKEFEDYIKVTNAMKAAGVYEVFTYNPIDLTVTYDYIEGVENQNITKIEDAAKMIAKYSVPIKADLLTIDKMHESLTGFKWPPSFYKLLKSKMEFLAHDDINAVNIIKGTDGYMPIDWERACLAPQFYDLGSWLINQVMYQVDNPKDKAKAGLLIEKLCKGQYGQLAKIYGYIDACFIRSYKMMKARERKVYGINGLDNIISNLEIQLF